MSGLLIVLVSIVGSLLVGSVLLWARNKLNVYNESRRHHHDELKQQVLRPIEEQLNVEYGSALVGNAPAVNPAPFASQAASPVRFNNPGAAFQQTLDGALLRDARHRHYPKLIAEWDSFRESYTSFISSCDELVNQLAQDCLDASGLPVWSSGQHSPFVKHFHLAPLAYSALFGSGMPTLHMGYSPSGYFIEYGGGHVAKGTREQIDELHSLVCNPSAKRGQEAKEIREMMAHLKGVRSALSAKLGHAIADQHLSGRCEFARFW